VQTRLCLGRIVATPAALRELESSGQTGAEFLRRHAAGDWGDALGAEDWEENQQALKEKRRVLSSYWLANGEKLWIITEWDRSVTTLLLPEDY